jgi:DNA-3-methyladenine glycosylase II
MSSGHSLTVFAHDRPPLRSGCRRPCHRVTRSRCSLVTEHRSGRTTDPYTPLAQRDPVLAELEARHGRPDPFHWAVADHAEGRFAGLLLHVVSQQISTSVALTMFARIEANAGRPPTPAGVLALGVDGLRACGLSRAKTASLIDIAKRISDTLLDLDALDAYSDDEVVARLTAARGIGPWTAQMFLIHQLRRDDVFPAGDLGIRHALYRAFQLGEVPSVVAATEIAQRWSPYRTYAAALLWASLLAVEGASTGSRL